ncbi:MAG: carboxylesterase family protein [Bacteroidota bacterium]
MRLFSICFACLISMSVSISAQQLDAFPVQTQLTSGTIEGLYDTKAGIQRYLGIPYAQPPVGELRWKAPQPLAPWQGVKETHTFGPRAIQKPLFGDMEFRSAGLSEDCLYLNVWTPAKQNTKDLPVLVYFYGGGFAAGDGSEPRYDGASMAQQGMVAITVNYRLNLFGFLAHPELSQESKYGGSGNYGLLDQQAALQWVQDNVAAFGGDPKRVTIAGESAGSISVSVHMASPLSRELIAGAIGESGASIAPTMPPVPLIEAEQEGIGFLQQCDIASIADLRKLSTRELYELFEESGRFGFPATIDGYLLPKTLPEIFEAGEQAQVPLLLGWNSAEIPGGAFMQGQAFTKDQFLARLESQFPEDQATIAGLFPHATPDEVEQSATDLASDGFINFSTWKWFDLHRSNSQQPVYRYLYSKLRPPISLEAGYPYTPTDMGAPHACEIEYCMGNLDLVKAFLWTEDDYTVSQTMQTYFANFIKTGNPNGADLVEWPPAPASGDQPPVMIIDTECEVVKAPHDARYRLWEKYYGEKR